MEQNSTMSTGTKATLWIVGILVVAIGGYALFFRGNSDSDTATSTPNTVACTMDAKLCPDGSYVGRVGPSCQFAACPGGTNVNVDANGNPYPADLGK